MIRPQVQVAPHKLSALVDPDGCRHPTSPPTLSGTSTTSTPQKEKRGSSAGEKRESVSTIEHTKLAACGQLIMHEVHRPGLIRPGGNLAVLTQLRFDPALGRLAR